VSFYVILNLAVFAGLIVALATLRAKTLSRRILAGLAAGVVYGLALQFLYADGAGVIAGTLEWTNVVGGAYVSLLRMIIIPLVLVMMIAAVVRMEEVSALGRIGGMVIGILVGTTMVAALVGIFISNAFGLSAEGLTQGARELERSQVLAERYQAFGDLGLADMLVRFIPSNVFLDMTEARPTSIIGVVIFGILFGIAALGVAREDESRGRAIREFIETAQAIVMKLVHMIMALTPYGILALITKVVAGSDASDILNLITFIGASYLAIAIMFVVHGLLIVSSGFPVGTYFKRVWPVLTFAFTSRSSAATIPLNVETQVEELKVPVPIANLSASFGATIGQNGCAGIYPAMLAVMIAPSMGVDPLSLSFMAGLVGIIAISSFGVAGVGGGATMAAFIVLPAMGFPVTVAALLISIEPLIDMARTALNVNGAMTAGVLTGRVLGGTSRADAAGASESAG
jgi:L-cystine uptake protein TcyP (sodium:dicarboxylate symporter family)